MNDSYIRNNWQEWGGALVLYKVFWCTYIRIVNFKGFRLDQWVHLDCWLLRFLTLSSTEAPLVFPLKIAIILLFGMQWTMERGKTLWFSPLSSLPKTQRNSLEERRILIFTKKSTLSSPLTQTYFQSTLLSTCYFKWQPQIRLCLQATPLVAGCSCYK